MTVSLARASLALAMAAALGACTTLSPQPRPDELGSALEARGGPAVDWAAVGAPREERAAIGRWLDQPMTLDAALRVAMLRSPRLQEEYAHQGLARAEVLEAVEISNPTLSLSRMSIDDGGSNRTVGLSLPLVDLIMLPARTRLAKLEYERATYEITGAVLGVVAEVESGWYEYVAARQVAAMREAVAEGAAASAELAQRFHDAGNISDLQLAQEQAVASEARIESLRARAEAGRKRLALNQLLGLHGDEADWEASDNLPLPVAREDDPALLARLAAEGNTELLAARKEAEVLADALGLTRSLRWLGGSEIGYEREKEADGARLRGPELALELPIFNQGQARLARAEAQLAAALARVDKAELSASQGVRLGNESVTALREVVRLHREALVPQRETIVARQQERQNFMLIGVFELVQAKLAEYDAYQAYLEAVRDYWLARVELARVVGQRLPSDATIGERTPGVQDILAPKGGMDHSMHGAMDHSKHEGMDRSQDEGMDHSKQEGMDHSKPEEMDHSGHEEMDHSKHEGMDHSKHEGMDHSKHEGMDHSKHEGMDHSQHEADAAEPEDDAPRHDEHDHGDTP
ncbi:TolC family protein [Arenimonas sp.]|uniref:TolC family protein n=1 Tax=Arenimonas sp. TaxID=1872635 RepID=UPI0025C20F8B|nr:TolC family protein [Arenimonas sp.]